MEWSELKKMIKRCLSKGGMDEASLDPYCEAAGFPRAAAYAAESLWINKIPEDEDTELLRNQLKALKNTGMFDLVYDLV